MKTVSTEVRSKGAILGNVDVPQYDSLVEAVKASSEADVLKAFNKVTSDRITNGYRTENTRTTSAFSQLAKLSKGNPEIEAEVNRLLAAAQATAAAQAENVDEDAEE